MRLPLTPSQTVGPYLHIGLDWLNTKELAGPDVAGERIVIEGRVLDAAGQPVPDALIELWQADADGRYAHPEDAGSAPTGRGFTGFGRCPTDADGRFRFSTIKPGSVPDAGGQPQAPHIAVNVFARGLLKQLCSRLYFPGDAHAADAVMACVPAERHQTLVARPVPDRSGTYAWDIVLGGGGADETVFFEF